MDLNYSARESAFRSDARSWLESAIPAELREKTLTYAEFSKEDLVRWHKILAAKGWIAPAWPREWGGTDWSAVERYIFEEECGYAGAPPVAPFGPTMCASVLLQFGTEDQKKRFLPRIYDGDDFWCQGYSEPGAGSDLASLKMSAQRQGDHFRVTGQKIWTTLAQYADWIFCLVRTSRSSRRQDGISFLLIDMKSRGVTVRPLVLLDESEEVNEVFFDDVEVPLENLVYEEGKGWLVAKHLLGHERLNNGRIGASKRELVQLKKAAAASGRDGGPMIDDVRFRDRLSMVEIELMALEITTLRFVDEVRRTGRIGPEVSMLKIRGTEIQQTLSELRMQVAGAFARRFRPVRYPDFDRTPGAVAARYFNYRKTSIYAGSNEIQRSLIAQKVLGL